MKNTLKEKLQMAYAAGENSVTTNKKIDDMLDDGVKQVPERASFDNWLDSKNQIKNVGEPAFESVLDCK